MIAEKQKAGTPLDLLQQQPPQKKKAMVLVSIQDTHCNNLQHWLEHGTKADVDTAQMAQMLVVPNAI